MSDFKAKCTKFDFRWSSAPDPAGGGLTALPRPISCIEGELLLRGGQEKRERKMERKGRGEGSRTRERKERTMTAPKKYFCVEPPLSAFKDCSSRC